MTLHDDRWKHFSCLNLLQQEAHVGLLLNCYEKPSYKPGSTCGGRGPENHIIALYTFCVQMYTSYERCYPSIPHQETKAHVQSPRDWTTSILTILYCPMFRLSTIQYAMMVVAGSNTLNVLQQLATCKGDSSN